MGFRKPFEAVPIKRGLHYREQRDQQLADDAADTNRATLVIALFGLLLGGGLGWALLAGSGGLPQTAQAGLPRFAEPLSFGRRRAPQAGDSWGGCNSARAAGTAPIYAGEPGYRSGMDGDGDGIACEPLPY